MSAANEQGSPAWEQGTLIQRRDRPAMPGVPPYSPQPRIIARDLESTKGKYKTDTSQQGVTLPLALHHVVPWATLRAFWGDLFKRRHFEAFKEFLSLYGVPKPQLSDLPAKVDHKQFQAGLWFIGDMAMDQLICWGKWNLVRGPAHRVQAKDAAGHVGFDPGEGFDEFHWFAGGHEKRLSSLRGLYDMMRTYSSNPQAVSTRDEQNVIAFLKTFRSMTVLAKVVEFGEDMWLVDQSSADYKPGGTNDNPRHPNWWKRQR
jgi:hypothetical protein